MINAGELDKRIIIQYPVITRAADGAETIIWTTLAAVWASVDTTKGREFWQAKQVNAEINHQVKIRYRYGIRAKYRLLYGARIFEIANLIDPDEKKVELILMCKEVVA